MLHEKAEHETMTKRPTHHRHCATVAIHTTTEAQRHQTRGERDALVQQE